MMMRIEERTKSKIPVSMMINVFNFSIWTRVLHVRVLQKITVKIPKCNHVVLFPVGYVKAMMRI
jgi:hypothetical protein